MDEQSPHAKRRLTQSILQTTLSSIVHKALVQAESDLDGR
jgi:hypothetical protein